MSTVPTPDPISPVVRRWVHEAREDPDAFWERTASEVVPWFRTWDRVFTPDPPSFRWFEGARTNLAWACLDHRIALGGAGRAALISANERGDREVLTYAQLRHRVRRIAAALRGAGIGRGDRVTLSMPVCVDSIAAMLACAYIGAIHSVVFAGFGGSAVAQRVGASGSKLILTADVTFRKGREVPLKHIVDEALDELGDSSPVERVVLLRRGNYPVHLVAGRDVEWSEFLAGGEGHSDRHEEMESNDPAFILATSGTTAAPKLAVHSHGGYSVGVAAMARWVYGLDERDVWWATSDIGWIVGHSYMVYGPLLVGATTVAYEGAMDHPSPAVLWELVEELHLTGVFTSPTAVRLLMRSGAEHARGSDLSSLERVACAGEALNPPAWRWLQHEVLGDRVPVLDHWWQTETGAPVVGNPYGLGMLPVKPGSGGVALPGMELEVVDNDGHGVPTGQKGILVIRRPFPSLTARLWGDQERYGRDYWGRVEGAYFTGDSVHIDEDGYVWFAGRADEVIKIAAHRIGTVEVESAFLTHPAVAEAGVTGKPDELRGEVIAAFVVLKPGFEPSQRLREELLAAVREHAGPVAVIQDLNFVGSLPKTRSGKIMRRVLKAVVLDTDPGDITTIEDAGSAEEARAAWEAMRGGGALTER